MVTESSSFERFKLPVIRKILFLFTMSLPKLRASTKQLLYKMIREELEVKRIYTRKNSVFCPQ